MYKAFYSLTKTPFSKENGEDNGFGAGVFAALIARQSREQNGD
jgi:hypothetical protein